MKTVKEVSRISGVSVRTLHHYDAIGLLKPTRVTEAGYRLYDEKALERLQIILLFREFEFPLKEIRGILDSPDFDPVQALDAQIHLLELKRKHLDTVIAYARQIQETGVIKMDFTPFDQTELEQYAAEAKRRWGATQAYQEFEAKTAGQAPAQAQADGGALMEIFARFGTIRSQSPASEQAQNLVAQLQSFISRHYYTCTKPILQGLGQIYIAGDSMTDNIDKAGGKGTAAFVNAAIEIYCKEE